MKRIILLFTASLLLLACSNDDNCSQPEEQDTSQSLKSFRYLEDGGSNPIVLDNGKEFLFDQDGRITIQNRLIDTQPVALTCQYSYDNEGKRDKIERKMDNDLYNTFSYEYNNQNQINKITNHDEDSGEDIDYEFEYTQNSIAILKSYDERPTVYSYNGNKLVNVSWVSDGLPLVGYELIYNGENVIQILEKNQGEVTGTYTFEYDDKINPLYSNFSENTFFYSNIYDLVDHFIIEHRLYYLSANNFTSIHYDDGNPNREYTERIEIEYNNNDMPVSSISYKNRTNTGTDENEVVRRMNYEYY